MERQPNTWLFGVTAENWEIVKSKNFWAVQTDRVRDKVKTQDRLVFYLVGSRPPVFVGAFRIVSDWRKSDRPFWPDEVSENRIKYHWLADLEKLESGAGSVVTLTPKLSFIDRKDHWPMYMRGSPGNFGHPISSPDLELITMKLREPPIPYEVKLGREAPPKTERQEPKAKGGMPKHNELRDMIKWIGRARGFVSETEYRINDYRLDCAWRKPVRQTPDQVWEVHIGGDFFEALAKLKHAWDLWGSDPFLVTTDEAARKAEGLLGGTFHEMKSDIRILKWQDVVKLYNLLKETFELEKEMQLADVTSS